ncbi:PREDICTED: pentatricopeptide repeat-containing protein At3g29290-like isoform X1 [Camelina sativa]|uniref:Pentatricopeptide repeat-containing protein At3g29290-like isoform X1 n=1 Tax=Camelina sativa TaxID=90675 RepID=A0ABM0TFP2_CAMSA|nr:PREDICTED: pentatricopeptide repeat-containing protein At3g29290-like isoform X2 [Camelina sativa]XP_010425731.1 PREDICTED: pentatricopeptide repeat-containing protein At3g29290-like isoform X1 [Camelina sativa]
MGDVWLSSVSTTATLNQLDCGCYSIGKRICVWRTGHWSLSHSLDFALTMKPKQKRRLGVKMESFSMATPRMRFRKVSSELDTSFNGESVVFGSELEAEHGLRERGCDLLVENGLEEKPVVARNRIHFLEERNEEMLSKRLLKLSRLDKIRSALELFDSMRFLGLQPTAHACNSFLSCLLRNGDIQKAFTVFEFMRKKENVTGHTYSLMLKAVAEVKGCDSALRMFKELERDPKHKSCFDVILYNTAISLCGRINNVCETERIWRVMKGDGHIGTEITYSLLVSIFVRCGRSELALDAYDEMVYNNISAREDAMYAMISACTKEENWDLALKIFQSMLKKRMKPNLVACNSLINSLGKAGKVGLVFKVYSVAKSLGHKADEYTWNALLTALYKANRYEDVLQLFDMVRSENLCCLNEYLYNTAMVSCQKLGYWEKAVKLLYEMEGSGLTVSTSSYNLVISTCEKSRKSKVALLVYQHMAQRDCKPNTFTYLSLVRSCIWGSLWNEVEDILEKVEPDVSLYNAAIHGMCLRREFKFAKELYVKMREMGLEPDGKTRAMMLQNLKKHQR